MIQKKPNLAVYVQFLGDISSYSKIFEHFSTLKVSLSLFPAKNGHQTLETQRREQTEKFTYNLFIYSFAPHIGVSCSYLMYGQFQKLLGMAVGISPNLLM